MKRVMQSLGLALVVTLSGCDQNLNLGSRCNSKTCKGCCDAEGVCQSGVTENACGVNGGMCLSCDGLQCLSGVCQGSATTGGGTGTTDGGTGGTGGGSAGIGGGGQVGRIDQELVSGTRLRAVRLVSADGAQMSANVGRTSPSFFDTQLQIYCAIKPEHASLQRRACSPVHINPLLQTQFSLLFVDAACQRYAERLESERPLPNTKWLSYGPRSDGGTGLFLGSKRYAGPLFEGQPDGGCAPSAQSAPADVYEADGREIMESELAVMEVKVD